MPKKEYKLGYIATDKNRTHPGGSVIENEYIKDEWVTEERLLEEMKSYNPSRGFLYTPTVLEIRTVPTEAEISKYANMVRSKLITALGYHSEKSMLEQGVVDYIEISNALDTLVEARRLRA